jgi:hypothetical protein
MTAHVPRLPFSLDLLVAEAKRRMRKRRVLIALVAVLVVGGAAGATAIVSSPSVVQLAGPCPVTGGFYAYAVPQDPAHPPADGAGASSWGWTPRKHQVNVGDRMRLNGRLWQVTGIAAMPGVEPVGRGFGIIGWPMPQVRRVNGKLVPLRRTGNDSLTMCGRLMFRPVG